MNFRWTQLSLLVGGGPKWYGFPPTPACGQSSSSNGSAIRRQFSENVFNGREITMADKLETLKAKYQSVLNFIEQQQNTQLQNVNMEGDKLFIRAAAPSQDVKNKIWDQIKLVDPTYSDLTAEISAPEAAAAAAAGGSDTTVAAARTYTVQAGDNLSKISRHFYGDPNQYMKIVNANKETLPDPDKIKPGMQLNIP
jgi:LysM repeat protein